MSNLYLIAEIGINHNGSVDRACRMIDAANSAGWNAVKFQKRTIDLVYPQDVLNKPRKSPWGTTTREQKEGLEFGQEQYEFVNAYCREVGIPWFASAWDAQSFEFLEQFDLPANKISSPMIVDQGLSRAVAETGRLTYISTGATNFEDICRTAEIFEQAGCHYVLMHCVCQYPVEPENAGLAQIKTHDRIFRISEQFPCFQGVGYSGHEAPRDNLPSFAAIALGARTIERHITLDRADYGSDQDASMEPPGMAELRETGDKILAMLGNGKIEMKRHEQAAADKLRAHIK